jgi:hypothetical protein
MAGIHSHRRTLLPGRRLGLAAVTPDERATLQWLIGGALGGDALLLGAEALGGDAGGGDVGGGDVGGGGGGCARSRRFSLIASLHAGDRAR